MSARVTCPACQYQFTVSQVGKQRICPNCQSPFVAEKPAEATGAAAPASQPALNKTLLGESDAPPIRFDCPRCQKPLQFAAIEAGMKRPCPACGQRLQVPAAPRATAQANLNKTLLAGDETRAQPSGIQPGQPAVAARPAPNRLAASETPATNSRVLLIGGGLAAGGLALLLLIGCVVSFVVISNKSRNAANLLALEAEMKALKDKERADIEASKRREQERIEERERENQEAKERKERDEADRRWQEEQLRLAKQKADADAEIKRRLDQKERERLAIQEEERKIAAAREKELKDAQAKADEAKRMEDAKFKKVIVGGPLVDLQTKGILGPAMFDRYRKGAYCAIHTLPMKAGNTYVIGLFSTWDNYLHLESPTGVRLASDDDSGGNRNARIVFRCPADGEYRIIVTSFGNGVTGPYALKVHH